MLLSHVNFRLTCVPKFMDYIIMLPHYFVSHLNWPVDQVLVGSNFIVYNGTTLSLSSRCGVLCSMDVSKCIYLQVSFNTYLSIFALEYDIKMLYVVSIFVSNIYSKVLGVSRRDKTEYVTYLSYRQLLSNQFTWHRNALRRILDCVSFPYKDMGTRISVNPSMEK